MPQLTAEHQAAHDHYLRLLEIYLYGQVSDDGRRWLHKEMSELERDMEAAGLLNT
ncbi:hypothetical protein ACI7RC_26095 [Brevibacillus sp. B_LB10_24]|uniref:hypothetical protein n=1 Tax=Brevibacillus TaxID=55080 RepID=UPI0002E1414B|nr:hypothetical protein [Brevibacillus massiliensis]